MHQWSKDNFATPLHSSKKQVRFNSSNISSPSDTQTPRPLSEIQNTDKLFQTLPNEFGEPVKGGNAFKPLIDSVYIPPELFGSNKTNSKPTEMSIPKPSSDLELSVFDSCDFLGNKTERPKTFEDLTLDKKLLENDLPYEFSPSQMPLTNSKMTEPSKSSVPTDFRTNWFHGENKRNDDHTLDFFTRPVVSQSSDIIAKQKTFQTIDKDKPNKTGQVDTCCEVAYDRQIQHCRFDNNAGNKQIVSKQTCIQRPILEPACNCVDGCENRRVHPSCCPPKPIQYQEACNCHYAVRNNTYRTTCCNEVKASCQQTKQRNCVDDVEDKRRKIEKKYGQKNESKNVDSAVTKAQEPTVADLYKIIQMQSEQLQVLQQRFDKLLTLKERQPVAESQPNNIPPYFNTPNNRNLNCVEHISIGVMTSFEMIMSSNNPSNDGTTRRDDSPKKGVQINEIMNEDPRTNALNIQQTSKDVVAGNNFLDGIERVNNMPTPSKRFENKKLDIIAEENCGNAIHNDSQTNNNNKCVNSNTQTVGQNGGEGWTFYNNVVNRVNDLLNSPPNTGGQNKTKTVASAAPPMVEERNSPSSNRILMETPRREFTRPSQAPVNRLDKPSTDLSLHMKQLASKYNIPANYMAKPTPYPAETVPNQYYATANNAQYDENQFSNMVNAFKRYSKPDKFTVIPGCIEVIDDVQNPCPKNEDVRHFQPPVVGQFGNNMYGGIVTDHSFATLQYMKRYHLVTVTNEQPLPMRQPPTPTRPFPPPYKNPSRILDITTLKQQPKLM